MMEIKRKTERRKLSRLISHHSSRFFSLKASLQQWLFDSQMQYSSIQLLINNAGIFATSSRFTSEGYVLVDRGVVETKIMREVPHAYPFWLSKF
ncbi:hypothetical protein RchiOBHm_Chr1g0340761 [Rosa chinensis]|uniref:Uncharacterized protein n=1 Tax=Rosa chinensis TaxID=74649 RepID=A0A2P6SDK3_ROSCH|nr:hypothetical protein RchiOBHm_Chr1g0340761 [Rosa chinensis]